MNGVWLCLFLTFELIKPQTGSLVSQIMLLIV